MSEDELKNDLNEETAELEEVSEQVSETLDEADADPEEVVENPDEESDDSDSDEDDSDDEDDEYEEEEEEEEEEEPLLTTFSDIDISEYKKMEQKMPSSVFIPYVIRTVTIIGIIAVVAAFFIPFIYVLPVLTLAILITIGVIWMLRGKLAEKAYTKMMSRNPYDTHRVYMFYDGYLRYRGNVTNARIRYFEIVQCVETEENFYLRVKGRRAIIILQKKNCSEELIAFVRGKFGSRN